MLSDFAGYLAMSRKILVDVFVAYSMNLYLLAIFLVFYSLKDNAQIYSISSILANSQPLNCMIIL